MKSIAQSKLTRKNRDKRIHRASQFLKKRFQVYLKQY